MNAVLGEAGDESGTGLVRRNTKSWQWREGPVQGRSDHLEIRYSEPPLVEDGIAGFTSQSPV
jgi:hypothetical protein